MNLKEIYRNDFSKSAFIHDDSHYSKYQVVGKFCVISQESDIELSIWITKYGDLINCVSPRKLTAIISSMPEFEWVVLNGEAYTRTTNFDLVRKYSKLLGIRQRRTISNELMLKLKSRFISRFRDI